MLANIRSAGHSLVVCYLDHKIVGQIFSRIHSGTNTQYFLPCLFSAAYAFVSFSIAAIFLKEVGSPLVKECRAHALLDCGHTPRRKAQYRGQF